MALPEFSMRQLLEAGVHFGHQTHRWNPKMAPYIFGARSNIHILDLSQTVPLLHQALVQAREVASKGGRILFVGTKRAASEPVAAAAQRCAQYYVNHRWLGGMLTNWQRIKDMGGKPDLMFVIDTNKETIAVKEARRLNIPVISILDSNCDPESADFPIPGNDDAARAIALYCDLIADAILDGMTESAAKMGMDLGAAENPTEVALNMPEAAPAEATQAAQPVAKTSSAPVEAAPVAKAEEESEYLRVTREYDAEVDPAIVTKIEKHLGASLSNKDSKYVACSDETELETIVKGFMKKKMGIEDKDAAMEKVKAVCTTMKPTRMKNRVTFYYLLAKTEGKLGEF